VPTLAARDRGGVVGERSTVGVPASGVSDDVEWSALMFRSDKLPTSNDESSDGSMAATSMTG